MRFRHRHGERDELYYRLERSECVRTLSLRIGIVVLILSLLLTIITHASVSTGILVECDRCKDYVFAKQIKKIDRNNFNLLDFCPDCYEFYINILDKTNEPEPNPFHPEENN